MTVGPLFFAPSVVAGGGAPLRFNPANKTSQVTLSASDAAAETETGGGHYGAMCNAPKSSGKWLYEMTVSSMATGGNIGFGIVNQSEGFSTISPGIGNGGNYWSRQSSPLARAYYANSSYNNLAVPDAVVVAGDVVTVAIDFAGTPEMKAWRNGALVATWSVSTIDQLGTRVYVPFVDLWGVSGTPTKATINDVIQYPQAGYSQWLT